MEIVRGCDRQLLYSGMAALVQRKVISSGPARKEKLLTMSLWPLSLSPSLPPSLPASVRPFRPPSFSRTGSQVYDVKLFPEDPVELIVGEALTLNCTALVEFDTGVNFQWSYPGKEVHGHMFHHRIANLDCCLMLLTVLLIRPTGGWRLSPFVKLCLMLQRLLASWLSTVSMSQTLASTAAMSPA